MVMRRSARAVRERRMRMRELDYRRRINMADDWNR
jgi:hypothetical protein